MRRKQIALAVGLLWSAALVTAGGAYAQPVQDITDVKDPIVGPGTVSIMTRGDTLLKFGALARIIPTYEDNFDFGAGRNVGDVGGTEVLRQHVNESGWVTGSYVRTEARVYFSAMPKDQSWSFYTALEFDRPLETASVDERGGKLDSSNDFGMERLLGTVALPWNNRLFAGWDVWGVDLGEAQGFVYGDDNPGFWLSGGSGAVRYSVGWWKLKENQFQNQPVFNTFNGDRDLYAGYVDYLPAAGQKIRAFLLYDTMNDVDITTTARRFSQAAALPRLGVSDAKSAHVGGYWKGTFGPWSTMAEGVYQFGSADASGLSRSDYDIRAYAVAADVTYDLKAVVGQAIVPRVGVVYASGDKSATDGKLGGYTGVTDFSRASKWGGENTISLDTNFVLGTPLYGMLPSGLGNGTPIVIGGLQNLVGAGFGRGDNPGLTMIAAGLTYTPRPGLIYTTNVNGYRWNEDFVVTSFVDGTTVNPVSSGYVGTEWTNELHWRVANAVALKGQVSFLFPGSALKRANAALTASSAGLGPQSAKTATRIAAELIWNF